MPKDITFYEGVQSGYDKLVSKDANGIYFISDTKSIYKGDTKYGGAAILPPPLLRALLNPIAKILILPQMVRFLCISL